MNNQIDIFYFFNDRKFTANFFDEHMKNIPKDVVEKIYKYHRWQDAQACLIGYSMIREQVFEEGQSWDSIWRNQYGKPYLDEGCFFNISHMSGMVILAKANFELGIDIEYNQHCDFEAILESIASSKKREQIADSRYPLAEFYKYWTKKEACVKQIGKGLAIPLSHFEIDENNVTHLDDRELKLVEIDTLSSSHFVSLAIPHVLYEGLSISITEFWPFLK